MSSIATKLKKLAPPFPQIVYTEVKTPAKHPVAFNHPSRLRYLHKSYLLDFVTTFAVFLIGGVFYLSDPPEFEFSLADPDISLTIKESQVPNWMAQVLAIPLPALVLLASQLWVRDVYDFIHSILGLGQALSMSFATTAFCWWSSGGLRPNFLQKCMPDPSLPVEYLNNTWPKVIMYTSEICTTTDTATLLDGRRGWPSGHASTAIAAWLFIALYLYAKLKANDRYSHFWKIFIAFLPVIFAIWICLTRIVDHQHSLNQLFWGIFIGLVYGPFAYTLHYGSLFGPDNHVPAKSHWGEMTYGNESGKATLPL